MTIFISRNLKTYAAQWLPAQPLCNFMCTNLQYNSGTHKMDMKHGPNNGEHFRFRSNAQPPTSITSGSRCHFPNGHHSSCLCRACCQLQQRQAAQPLAPAQQQRQQQQTPPQPPPAEEANNSDGDSSSADDGRPQYFIRNSDSSATSGDESSDDSSFDSSGAGAESAGDSPQGKIDVVQSRQDGGFYPTRGRVAQKERDRERDEETERGV